MASKFDICSKALAELGEDAISSFTANTPPSNTCGLIYPEYIKYLLSIHEWNFTLKKIQLARLTEGPLNEWKYAYQMPSDLLVFRAFFTGSETNILPQTNYQIYQNQVYTNETTVYIDYQFQPDESQFPPYFLEFAVKALATKLALPITDDLKILQLKKVEAFGNPSDNLNGGEFAVAKRIDSIQSPSPSFNSNGGGNDLLVARFS